MTTPLPSIARDKSPLLDADHDAVRIADALRRSPHITFVAPAAPGDETVRFRDADGIGIELSLSAVEPDPDAERVAYAHDAVAAAIGNHPHFIRAVLEQPSFGLPNLDAITAFTRTGNEYTLTLTAAYHPDRDQEHGVPAEDIAYAADRLLSSDPSDSERATAELLNYVAATWDRQDLPLREHAQALATALSAGLETTGSRADQDSCDVDHYYGGPWTWEGQRVGLGAMLWFLAELAGAGIVGADADDAFWRGASNARGWDVRGNGRRVDVKRAWHHKPDGIGFGGPKSGSYNPDLVDDILLLHIESEDITTHHVYAADGQVTTTATGRPRAAYRVPVDALNTFMKKRSEVYWYASLSDLAPYLVRGQSPEDGQP
ncbi:hypothetical protein [Streptomyces durocortorensis]|uniref:Uncharacterized protein n=1 Tax=Streptomyces durocortorensis TaxID=2811104 RepID=A0ABS2I7T5_9ACTN|nr:hypothetical protein [Streptomyces durocortorensis]MBM7057890.1 hypothetical protein [Streptomyces durocortorensis]